MRKLFYVQPCDYEKHEETEILELPTNCFSEPQAKPGNCFPKIFKVSN